MTKYRENMFLHTNLSLQDTPLLPQIPRSLPFRSFKKFTPRITLSHTSKDEKKGYEKLTVQSPEKIYEPFLTPKQIGTASGPPKWSP